MAGRKKEIYKWPIGKIIDEKKEAIRKAKWLETGEVIRTIISPSSLYDPKLKAWDYRRFWIWLAQLMSLAVAPCLAGFIATRDPNLPVELGWGPIVSNIARWILLASGASIAKQSFEGFIPLRPLVLVIIFLLVFMMPIWEWYKLNEAKDRKND